MGSTCDVYANSHVLAYPIPGRGGSVEVGERLINVVRCGKRDGVRRQVSVPPGALRPDHVAEAVALAGSTARGAGRSRSRLRAARRGG